MNFQGSTLVSPGLKIRGGATQIPPGFEDVGPLRRIRCRGGELRDDRGVTLERDGEPQGATALVGEGVRPVGEVEGREQRGMRGALEPGRGEHREGELGAGRHPAVGQRRPDDGLVERHGLAPLRSTASGLIRRRLSSSSTRSSGRERLRTPGTARGSAAARCAGGAPGVPPPGLRDRLPIRRRTAFSP